MPKGKVFSIWSLNKHLPSKEWQAHLCFSPSWLSIFSSNTLIDQNGRHWVSIYFPILFSSFFSPVVAWFQIFCLNHSCTTVIQFLVGLLNERWGRVWDAYSKNMSKPRTDMTQSYTWDKDLRGLVCTGCSCFCYLGACPSADLQLWRPSAYTAYWQAVNKLDFPLCLFQWAVISPQWSWLLSFK